MIRLANVNDAHLVHQIMMQAFEEYRHIEVPTSALDETISSIEESIHSGMEKALLYFTGIPLGSARFKVEADSIYFSRLSVTPEARGRGIVKSIVHWLEDYAKQFGK